MQFGTCADPKDAAWIARAGADFIEAHVQNFLRPADETWEPAVAPDGLAVPVAGYNCFFPGNLKVTGPEADLERITAYAGRAFERAARMGSDFIVFGSGGARGAPDGWPLEKARDQLAETLRAIGPLAAEAGVTIVMEPLHRGETNLLTDVPETLDLVRRANAPGVALLCDLFHFARENEPLDHLDGCRGALGHVHIAEPEGRVAPAPGLTDYRPFFAKLKGLGYQRRISIECTWKDAKRELGPCLEFLRREWAAA